ncbi:MAG: hypothetical protein ABS49_13110 [Erythrobacter sp. SCN 62-14]|nr:MAG: hypothetical protein ABS49_13110 [Erythrobacter sp. SCN 62-14]
MTCQGLVAEIVKFLCIELGAISVDIKVNTERVRLKPIEMGSVDVVTRNALQLQAPLSSAAFEVRARDLASHRTQKCPHFPHSYLMKFDQATHIV